MLKKKKTRKLVTKIKIKTFFKIGEKRYIFRLLNI